MPRLVGCAYCRILQRIPDVLKGTPLIPARLEWTTGEQYTYLDDQGLPVMVPAYDPILEDFIENHGHDQPDDRVIGGLITVWQVDQRTWDTMDVVTKIQKELQDQTNQWYEERDEYRESALKCYNDHGNPDLSSGCRDYMDDSKRIGHASYTDDDGRTITVPPKFRQYLCYVCPYQQTYIQVELRRRRGAYNQ
jgi:hypothetical protein